MPNTANAVKIPFTVYFVSQGKKDVVRLSAPSKAHATALVEGTIGDGCKVIGVEVEVRKGDCQIPSHLLV